MRNRFKKEEDFILWALRRFLDFKEELNFYIEDLNWNHILKRAEQEAITNILYFVLKEEESLPIKIKSILKARYYHSLARNILIKEEIKRLLYSLTEHNIEAIILKGIFLSEFIYPDPGLRTFGDVDILVKREDIRRLHCILLSLGYESSRYYSNFCEKNFPFGSFNSLIYPKKDARFSLHIHWHLLNNSWPIENWVENFRMEFIWEKKKPLLLEGISCFALSPEHQVIYLASHYFFHHFRFLISAIDILETIHCYKKEGLTEDFLFKEAKKLKLEQILLVAFKVIGLLLGIEAFPIEGINFKLNMRENFIVKNLIFERMRYSLVYLLLVLLLDNFKKRILFIKRSIFPSKDNLAHSLDIALSEVSYFDYLKRIMNFLKIQ